MSEPWELLWDRAMVALDSLQPGFKAGVSWSFGGGTAMRMFYDHRDSKDIDIFVTDALVISYLSPRLNDTTERQVGSNYNEQSNIVKLRFPEGEADFIIGGHLVPAVPYERMTIRGREANVERPIEVVAKKCFYRATDFTARDVFDLAVLLDKEPGVAEEHRGILLAKHDELVKRFSYLRAAADAEPAVHERAAKAREGLQKQIDLIAATPAFEWVKSSAIDSVLAFIERDRIQRIGGR